MSIIQVATNLTNTSVIMNTATGVQMALNTTVSDAQIIGRMCTNYNFYILAIYAMVLLILIGKAFLRRLHLKKPDNETIKTLYQNADDMIDMVLIFVIMLNILIYFFFS